MQHIKQIDDFLNKVITAEELEKLIDEEQKSFLDPNEPHKAERQKRLEEAREIKKQYLPLLN